MLGSQLIDMNRSISGADIGVPEIKTFGFVSFQQAVPTTDSWTDHDGPELVFMIEGRAYWELETETLVSVSGNQFVLFPAKRRHRIADGLYPPNECFWIVMNGSTRNAPTLLTPEGMDDFHKNLGRRGLTYSTATRCQEAIIELSKLVMDPRIYAGSSLLIAEIRAQLHVILIEAWKAQDQRESERHSSELVQEFLRRIHSDPHVELNITEAAMDLGYSRSYLHNRFRKEVGMSPNDYAQRLRAKRCCERLITTDDPITDIAMDFGFGSSQYFARFFKKFLGTTPSEYRQKMLARES